VNTGFCRYTSFTMLILRRGNWPHVTRSNDAILCKAGRTTAVSLVGTHHEPGDALGHSFGAPSRGPAGQRQSRRQDQYDYRGWRIKGNGVIYDQSLPRGGIMTLGYHYGLPETNAGEHSCGGNYGYYSCFPRVPIRCRKPSGSTL
jgi:hypothetical protein